MFCFVFLENIPFKIVRDHFVYIGLTIPKDPKLLYKLNFVKLLSKLKCNIENWKIMPFSMIGRINSIKIVSLPRLLYICEISQFVLLLHFLRNWILSFCLMFGTIRHI